MSGPPLLLIENYLREAGFWHAATIGRDAHIPSSTQIVYYHFGRRPVTIRIADGWVRTHRLTNLVRGLPCWQHCTGRCAGRRDQIKPKSEVAYHYYNHGLDFAFHFYVLEWNHPASYIGIPTALKDIRLLLDQRSEAQHKIDLRLTNTNWPLFWSKYIKIWENWYDHIPDRKPIIVLELACTPDYMPWFKIHGKPYLLSEEQRRQQICVERERWGPLYPMRRDDGTSPSTAPTQSLGPSIVPTQSPGPSTVPHNHRV
ncbi:hypothetical protein CXB51_014433 [Gossypium anomalum]|uniref:Aminotransferase-like plant mobile domain-containing protein n=1 Tax=Gossypium anomalum TaxID=47600 RepID=A0A8J6D0F5_9ROSI|nr:hypothetical protein CXB51_014433 [Gossypium anomalum]